MFIRINYIEYIPCSWIGTQYCWVISSFRLDFGHNIQFFRVGKVLLNSCLPAYKCIWIGVSSFWTYLLPLWLFCISLWLWPGVLVTVLKWDQGFGLILSNSLRTPRTWQVPIKLDPFKYGLLDWFLTHSAVPHSHASDKTRIKNQLLPTDRYCR